MLEIARIRLKRMKHKAKSSAFYINERPVKEANINRFLKRNNISESSLLSMASPVNGKKSVLNCTLGLSN
jgi:chromosome segregation ATPase